MKILIVADETWNDCVYGNNVLSSWFDSMKDAEFAQLFAIPGKPLNNMCTEYFQLTDYMMLKSLVGTPAGRYIHISRREMLDNPQTQNYISNSGFYSFMKKISGMPVTLLREFIWSIGRYNKIELSSFIKSFQPDVVFCPRRLTWKMMRIEKEVSKYTTTPFIAFTGDDEASLRQWSYSPLFWINRFFFRRAFRRHVSLFSHYFMHSADQSEEYAREYALSTSTLFKSGVFPDTFTPKAVGNPIRLVYAGHIYCNRWKSLSEIGNALKIINRNGTKMILDIFTQDKLSDKQRNALSDNKFIYLKGSVSPERLIEEYRNADIALHVESFDRHNRLLTRVSFSTKIIDLMASSCAIMAICWEEHTAYKYLKENDAAFCLSSYEAILPQLNEICENPSIIQEYAKKAYECGKRNHSRDKIQQYLKECFQTAIDNTNSR